MKKLILQLVLSGLIGIPAIAQEQQNVIPDWVRGEWEFLVRGSGTWIADNSAFKSDNNPYDAFGIHWEYGLGKKSLKGRLYGIIDEKDIGTFWEFRIFYHPQEKQVIAMQFGSDGTYGVGPQKSIGGDTTEMWQEFFNPDGTSSKVGHRAKSEGNNHITDAFNIDKDGVWTKRRSYTWILKN